MKVPRNFSILIQYCYDELIPPILRDSKWFMYLPMRLILKDTTNLFFNFKDYFFSYTPDEIANLYAKTLSVNSLQGETDLNVRCSNEIIKTISGKTVLEIGCGRGYLLGLLSHKGFTITACDIFISNELTKKYPNINFTEASIEKLPFKNNSFDTVITTHTLEHVQNLSSALSELRRIARKEIIIVVPRQRPYKYNFNLHTQFFPYQWSLQNAFGHKKNAYIKKMGDWFYCEKV